QAMQILMKNGGVKDADRYGPNVVRSIEGLLREIKATARRGYGPAFGEAEFGGTAGPPAVRGRAGGARPGAGGTAGPRARVTEKTRARTRTARSAHCG